jgi:hypothetical protein
MLLLPKAKSNSSFLLLKQQIPDNAIGLSRLVNSYGFMPNKRPASKFLDSLNGPIFLCHLGRMCV